MNNQKCKVRPEIIKVDSEEQVFFPFSITTSKRSGNGNHMNNPNVKLCVPDVVKNVNVRTFI